MKRTTVERDLKLYSKVLAVTIPAGTELEVGVPTKNGEPVISKVVLSYQGIQFEVPT